MATPALINAALVIPVMMPYLTGLDSREVMFAVPSREAVWVQAQTQFLRNLTSRPSENLLTEPKSPVIRG